MAPEWGAESWGRASRPEEGDAPGVAGRPEPGACPAADAAGQVLERTAPRRPPPPPRPMQASGDCGLRQASRARLAPSPGPRQPGPAEMPGVRGRPARHPRERSPGCRLRRPSLRFRKRPPPASVQRPGFVTGDSLTARPPAAVKEMPLVPRLFLATPSPRLRSHCPPSSPSPFSALVREPSRERQSPPGSGSALGKRMPRAWPRA